MLKTDYRDAMCDGARKYRITTNPDGTSGIADMTVYTQEGDRFGCNDINATNQEVNALSKEMPELKKSVGDGKARIAAAITRKKVSTEATATFEELASSVDRIRLGSGNAVESQVLKGVTFSNSDGLEHTGTMPDNPAQNAVLNCGDSWKIPAGYTPGGTVKASSLASQTGGVTADDGKVLSGYTYWRDGVKRTGNMPDRGGYQGTGNSSGNDAGNRRFYVNIPNGYYDNNAPVLLPWDRVKSWIGLTPDKIKKGVQIMDVTGIAEGYVPSATDLYYRGNNPANWRNFPNEVGASFDAGQISIGLRDSELGKLVTMVRLKCDPISTVGYNYLNIEVSSFTLSGGGIDGNGSFKFTVGGVQAAAYGNMTAYTGVITLNLSNVQAEGEATLLIARDPGDTGGFIEGIIHRIWLS